MSHMARFPDLPLVKDSANNLKSCSKTNAFTYVLAKVLTLFRMGLFGAAHGWGVQKAPPP